jgi:hypothetical protein
VILNLYNAARPRRKAYEKRLCRACGRRIMPAWRNGRRECPAAHATRTHCRACIERSARGKAIRRASR